MADIEAKREVRPVPESFSGTTERAEQEPIVSDRDTTSSFERTAPAAPQHTQPTPTPAVSSQKSQALQEIESVLAEDLEGIYAQLSPPDRAIFQQRGEILATRIRELFVEAKVRANALIKMIVEWLRLLPGVNWAFVEQEAKIKTDKLMHLKDQVIKE